MNETIERALLDLFGAMERLRGPVYECKYYPCHFAGQDCSLCFCPFYPCFIYKLGGELAVSSTGKYIWNCKNCFWIHEKENVEEVVSYFSTYPRQVIVEADWYFFSRALQNILFGQELGEKYGSWYSMIWPNFYGTECTEIDGTSFLAVKLNSDLRIESVRRVESIDSVVEENSTGILIPEKSGKILRKLASAEDR